MTDQTNEVLASLLMELGWSPRALARKINHVLGTGTVAQTAPYHWRDGGRTPRPPLPTVTAWVLSRELGRTLTVSELWQGRAVCSPLVLPADFEIDLPWSRTGTMSILDDWVRAGLLDRRHFLAVSGVAVTSIAAGYPATAEPGRLANALGRGCADNPLLDQIEQSIPLLQRLDDANGGGAHLPYVGAQLRAVALLLREGGHTGSVELRLFAALAELAQLAGWMAFDAGKHGLAQRYLFTALRTAREAGYHPMAAHALGDLAFQAASRGYPADAVPLGEAAARVAATGSAGVRASVQTRLAYGYAVAGRLDDFERAYAMGLDQMGRRDPYRDPAWMYYLSPNHLDTQAGYSLTHAAAFTTGAADRTARRSLLRRGEQLLRTGAHDLPLDHPSQRRALFEGAWLSVAAACRGDFEQACTTGQRTVARLDRVQSARSADVLRLLARRLRRAGDNEYVRDFLPVLERVVARQSVPA